jgi:hypothetical protein
LCAEACESGLLLLRYGVRIRAAVTLMFVLVSVVASIWFVLVLSIVASIWCSNSNCRNIDVCTCIQLGCEMNVRVDA